MSLSSKKTLEESVGEALDHFAEKTREYTRQQVGAAVAVMAPTLIPTVDTLGEQITAFMNVQGFRGCDNTGEKIALMHSELSEALEADRKDLPSDHIEGFTGVEEELADTVIRILDFAGHHQLRLGEAIIAKLQFNLSRPYKHGKAY